MAIEWVDLLRVIFYGYQPGGIRKNGPGAVLEACQACACESLQDIIITVTEIPK